MALPKLSNDEKLLENHERAERIAIIENLEAKIIEINEPISQKEAEQSANKEIVNKSDGRSLVIPKNTIGKIYRHKGYDISKIFSYIPSLYETSILGWTEPVIQKKNGKKHINIKAYHHYINKFTDNTDEYFIRFAVNEVRVKQDKIGKSFIHSVSISNMAIYKKGDESLDRVRLRRPGVKDLTSPFIDKRLIEFFNSVKENL